MSRQAARSDRPPPHRAPRAGRLAPWLRRSAALVLLPCLVGSAARAQQPAPTAPAAGASGRLLVVAPGSLAPELAAFVAHKRRSLAAELRSLEDILRDHPGTDDPEKLKRCLYEEWRSRGLGYVLLVGDVDVMPVRFMVLDRVTPAAFDYAFYPSDLYYADLARADRSFDDWNARKEDFHASYFGEVRGEKNKGDPINYDQVDYRPEIAVGRWPVSTAGELRVVVAKTIASGQGPPTGAGGAPPRAAFIAVGGWVDSRGLLDELAGKLPAAWQVEKRYYADAARPSGSPPDPQQLRRLLDDGVDLLVHSGHGQPDSWEQCFSVGDLRRIRNAARLPVVISAGCSTAHFSPLPPYEPYVDMRGVEHAGSDHGEVFTGPPPPPSPYQRGRFNPTGLGEEFLKLGPNGGVAYIGCNTGSQPCGLTLVEGFVGAVAGAAGQPRLGDCWTSAIRHFFEKQNLATLKPDAGWYPPSIFFQGMKFMVFGDPSLPLP